MPGFGPLLATMITALVSCSRGINATVTRLQASAAPIPNCRKLP
jgi:hypothetical protein